MTIVVINPPGFSMFAHLQSQVGGWWSGVLHPMEAPGHLVTMLIVGLLGGLSVRVGRSSWAYPALFVSAAVASGLISLSGGRALDHMIAVHVLAGMAAAMVFVDPRHIGVVGPVVASASGALHGVGHAAGTGTMSSRLGFLAGFVFTSSLLLTVSAIVGASVGHFVTARRAAATPSTQVDDPALV